MSQTARPSYLRVMTPPMLLEPVKERERPRVLVVEDNQEISGLVREVLETQSLDVVLADSASVVPEMAEESQPDLFLIDLMLPDISGLDVAHDLRERGFRDVPMVSMSGSYTLTAYAITSGLFQAGVQKPFDIEVLLGEIQRLLGQAPAEDIEPIS